MNRLLLCLIVSMFVVVPFVAAQAPEKAGAPIANEPIDSAPTQGDADKQATTQSIGGMVVSGGILNIVFFGVLGLFSLGAVTVIFERLANLTREKLLPGSFKKQITSLVDSTQTHPAKFKLLCESHDSPASRIFQAGLLRAGRPVPEVEKAMEDAAAREMALIRGKNRPLGVVGNVAPLVGLLGTVVGMIMAFQISSEEGLGKAERLAEGIYLALMTTAAGLTIAIPCLLAASWFTSRAERYMCEIGECLARTMPSFARMEGKEIASSAAATADSEEAHRELSRRERFLMGEEA